MKTNELMIGDLIFCGKEPMKVDYDIFLPGHLTESHTPIHLTKEILEANDFVYNENYHCYVLYRDCAVSIKVGVFTEEDFHFNIFSYLKEIEYVHELQHALRLCGLSELVDNFKLR